MTTASNEGPPSQQPAWFTAVSESISTLHKKVDDLISELSSIKALADYAVAKADETFEKVKESERKISNLECVNEKLTNENRLLWKRVIQIEGQSRRNNLLFDGISETPGETWEKTEDKIKKFIKDQLHLPDDINMERVHRIGVKDSAKARTIIARFSFYKQREEVWKARTKLSKSNVWISEDFPPEVKRDRQILLPIYRSAKNQPGVTSCSLKVNKLFINNKKYDVGTLSQLPEHLKPENLCSKSDETNKVTVFFRRDSLLSNFNTTTPIEIEGVSFNCVEQYFQYEKALFFKKDHKAAEIKKHSDPRSQKRIGDQIKGSSQENERWFEQAKRVMANAVKAKMDQNPHARKALLNTKDHKLGEASRDLTWGTGVAIHHRNATNTNSWGGKNFLGEIMTQVRDSITF